MLYLSLRHYTYVTAIARHGSLSAAALEVNVSQPALSAALSRIEAHLGQRLFLRRKGAALVLTPQGRHFVRAAEALLAQAAQLENPDSPQPPLARVDLGCFVDLAPFLLAPVLQQAKAMMPELDLRYRVDGFAPLTDAMLKGQIDLAISFDLGLDDGFERHPIGQAVPHALVAADDPLAGRDGLSLRDLQDRDLILFEDGLSVQHVLRLFRAQGLRPKVAHRARTLEILRSLAAHGMGVGISYTLPPSGQSYDGRPVTPLRIVDPGAAEPIVIARHRDSPPSPEMARLIRMVEDMAQDMTTAHPLLGWA
ncbi:MAG: LysR family transcriptional regulator [Marinibacterium sp.]|nr:LysR family transcriptional regulator [Marinibacterium sp.]